MLRRLMQHVPARGDFVNQPALISIMIATVMLMSCATSRAAETPQPPLRPPAVPLIASDPYFSVWSFNDRLTDGDTHHWTGRAQTVLSLVRIDGKAYRVAGAQPSNV